MLSGVILTKVRIQKVGGRWIPYQVRNDIKLVSLRGDGGDAAISLFDKEIASLTFAMTSQSIWFCLYCDTVCKHGMTIKKEG